MALKAHIGIRLRKIRKRRGLTQERLAELADRSVDAISAIERGAIAPSIETLERVAAGLGVSAAWFFLEEEQLAPDGEERSALWARLLAAAHSLTDDDLRVAAAQIEALARRT